MKRILFFILIGSLGVTAYSNDDFPQVDQKFIDKYVGHSMFTQNSYVDEKKAIEKEVKKLNNKFNKLKKQIAKNNLQNKKEDKSRKKGQAKSANYLSRENKIKELNKEINLLTDKIRIHEIKKDYAQIYYGANLHKARKGGRSIYDVIGSERKLNAFLTKQKNFYDSLHEEWKNIKGDDKNRRQSEFESYVQNKTGKVGISIPRHQDQYLKKFGSVSNSMVARYRAVSSYKREEAKKYRSAEYKRALNAGILNCTNLNTVSLNKKYCRSSCPANLKLKCDKFEGYVEGDKVIPVSMILKFNRSTTCQLDIPVKGGKRSSRYSLEKVRKVINSFNLYLKRIKKRPTYGEIVKNKKFSPFVKSIIKQILKKEGDCLDLTNAKATNIEVSSVKLDDQTPIYDDVYKTKRKRNFAEWDGSEWDCDGYEGKPTIIYSHRSKECQKTDSSLLRICIGKSMCKKTKGEGVKTVLEVYCQAEKNGTCPAAKYCAASSSMGMTYDYGAFLKREGKKATSRRAQGDRDFIEKTLLDGN